MKLPVKNWTLPSLKVSSNQNLISEMKKANCIGYSSLFNSIGNYIIRKQKLTDKYEFIHLIGELDFFGFNIHNLFDSLFFKDHDFNEIKNKLTGEKKFVDPSLRDYLRIEYVRSKWKLLPTMAIINAGFGA